MAKFFDLTVSDVEHAILIGVASPGQPRWETEDYLDELNLLAETAGARVVDRVIQERKHIDAAFFIGEGKVEEIKTKIDLEDIDTVIFDEDLSPTQIRNLERKIQRKIIDRSSLILDIFSQRAKSRESKTQVELAQLQHLAPRLTRQWIHLSRQQGGIGMRGPGETQLETDRRMIRERISHLKLDLEKIEDQRYTRRKARRDLFQVALIGYTNVGKSTLMNALSRSESMVENQLFATLDPLVRRVSLSAGHTILLTDTVGFIRKLPHQLIASFKSTLEEAVEADLLLHLIDVSHPHFEAQMDTVQNVLEDLNIHDKEMIMVFNKIDKVDSPGLMGQLSQQFPQAIFISANRGIHLQELRRALIQNMDKHFVVHEVRLHQKDSRLVHIIYDLAEVVNRKYEGDWLDITFKAKREFSDQIFQSLNEARVNSNN